MVDLQGTDIVAVLTRAPSAGGKTRLFRDLGSAPVPDLLAALLLDTLDAVALAGVTRVLCYTPRTAETEMRALAPPDVVLMAQHEGDLGDRMRGVFDDLFARGARSVVLIGSDLPGIEGAAILAAQRVIRERPAAVVLGPARDGGYYLVAASHTPAGLFRSFDWGSRGVLAETERRARAAGLEVVSVAAGRDIDTLEDLRALLASDAPAPRTRMLFNRRGGVSG
jgi:hypothetical protein